MPKNCKRYGCGERADCVKIGTCRHCISILLTTVIFTILFIILGCLVIFNIIEIVVGIIFGIFGLLGYLGIITFELET